MSTATIINARRALRDALHRRVRGVDDWSKPSMAVFCNCLLDDVGSDARPLVNLLLEAVDRGALTSLTHDRMAPALWTARCTSLVMRWVGERFVQPEAARWAVESWAYALGTIESSQLTVLPDAPHGSAASQSRGAQSGDSAANSYAAAGSDSASASALPPIARTASPRPAGRATTPSATAQSAWRAPAPSGFLGANTGRTAPYPRAVAARRPSAPRTTSGFWPQPLDNVVSRTVLLGLTGIVATLAIIVARGPDSALDRQLSSSPVASSGAEGPAEARGGIAGAAGGAGASGVAPGGNTPPDRAAFAADSAQIAEGLSSNEYGSGYSNEQAAGWSVVGRASGNATNRPNDGIGLGGQATRVPLAPGSGFAPSLAMTRLPVQGATPSAYLELTERSNMRGLREGASKPTSNAGLSPNAAGVPGITQNALPLNDRDASRVRRVAPATRPSQRSPQPSGSITTRARASERSAAPGLDEIRLESGRRLQGRVEVIRASSVVFRDATTGLRYEFPKDDIDEIITEFGNPVRFRERGGAKPGSAGDRRASSVAGRYEVRYDAARVNGSPTCKDLWRGPSGSDVATIRHRAGDDTLSVVFEGGDTFPSALDADGFFNSTFRIMPGQAELATALTTRLSGWIAPDGSLALQVNVIGYRRVQGTSGVSCHIIVDATGTRTP